MKILYTGGGTGGSVTPLIAIHQEFLKSKDSYECLWIGTKHGPEKHMVIKERIPFKSIFSGKLRRYFSLHHLIDPFKIIFGFFQSFFILLMWRPNFILSAGGFVSVSVIWAGFILRIPILIHQQDVRPGLANKLTAPLAQLVTVTFEKSLKDYGEKAIWTGNPMRNLKAKASLADFQFSDTLPVVLIMGGGTGSLAINNLVRDSRNDLVGLCNTIHITGKEKFETEQIKYVSYYQKEFLGSEELAKAYLIADIVISRSGMGALTELSNLEKPTILIPMPHSHQEDNARVFKEARAAIVLDQNKLDAKKFVNEIKKLLNNIDLRKKLSANISSVIKKNASSSITKLIKEKVAAK
ncbi:MAG: UDP-N-acetylglucosamine--N-acetylmuramyl-(pentapeptide) pyrophosphoryl-undecaprenol N-acetylglucosamine transferase [Candidatus Falkowbacteria bacterium]|nr:UDP-N-acetylglucosamine--N-acetylmuramyl-(pentapeptide) pyrophosphoryl-undecaprenol N-acetylglucosamine transferase [Candidatus Falkowbacteria bacterium]